MILIIGDTHFKRDNLQQCKQHYNQIEQLLTSKNIQHVVHLGDAMHYHEKLYTECLEFTCSYFRMITTFAPLHILVGNHDMINNQVFCDSTQNWASCCFANEERIHVYAEPRKVKLSSINCLFVPYIPTGRFMEALQLIDLKGVDICFAHQEFRGCKLQHDKISEFGDVVCENFPQIISGHVHGYQKLNKILYVGSAFEHQFGASECYLHLMDYNLQIVEKIPSISDKKIQIFVDNLQDLQTLTLPEYKCKIKICCTMDKYTRWRKTEEAQQLCSRHKIEFVQQQQQQQQQDYCEQEQKLDDNKKTKTNLIETWRRLCAEANLDMTLLSLSN